MNHVKRAETVGGLIITDEKYIFTHPNIELGKIAQNSKPTIVARGVSKGYSLPIFNSDDEEVFMCDCVPRVWDGVSNPNFALGAYLDTANTGKNFKLQMSWEHYNPDGDVVSTTSNDVEVETATGTAAQYKSFQVEFPIDYDVDGAGNELKPYERLCMRLRRIAASENEITGEIVVVPPAIFFLRNKV